jgi:hypothetical protein
LNAIHCDTFARTDARFAMRQTIVTANRASAHGTFRRTYIGIPIAPRLDITSLA